MYNFDVKEEMVAMAMVDWQHLLVDHLLPLFLVPVLPYTWLVPILTLCYHFPFTCC